MNNLTIDGTSYSLVEIQSGITIPPSSPFVSIEGKIYVGEAVKDWHEAWIDLVQKTWTRFPSARGLKEITEEEKKGWEVLSFKDGLIIYEYDENGRYKLKGSTIFPSVRRVEFETVEILSVKRLTDGEVFSIGDTIGSKEGVSISKFIISNNNLIVESEGAVTDYMFGYPSGVSLVHSTEGIGSLKKYIAPRKPILTTADGVTIYEDEKDRIVYGLLTKGSWEKNEGKAGHVVLWSSRNTWLFFSEKYARDEFEINKRPTLSLSDVILFLDAIKWEAQPKDMPALRRLAIGKLNCK